jgi:hypothetical protein
MSLQNIKKLIDKFETNLFYSRDDGMGEGNLVHVLRLQLDDAQNADWSRNELADHILSDSNDLEDEFLGLSDAQREEFREIQHGIINYFGE